MIKFIEKLIPRKIKPLYDKYKTQIWYLIFGGFTTVVNILAYYICYNVNHMGNKISNVIAWILAVTFAYLTNRTIVFNSQAKTVKDKTREIVMFYLCRLATGVLDLVIMTVTVEYLKCNALLWKIISNVIVIVSNYVASKLVIFAKPKK